MMIGQQYKILSELGAGGMGIVYQAVEVLLEREVAIKKLRSEFSRSSDVAERFRKEAKIQARLNHPNLAHLYNFFKDGDAFYIAMEFVSGSPLSRLIPMKWEHALPVFTQILDSLEYAHSLGVLHRDIKPDNIMVSPKGEVKVMDFGIAHVLGSVRQTREKSIIGTLEYISPEQIGGKEIGPWTDIYSLGVLLFEVISGRLPFAAEAEFELLKHHLETPAPKVSSVASDVTPFLDEAVGRAMAKAPADRFVSCRAFADFLKQSAPEVFAAPAGSSPRPVQNDEIERCVRRISAMIDAGEFDLAALIVERALADYPGQLPVQGCETRLKNAAQARANGQNTSEKSAYLEDIFRQLVEFEKQGNLAAGLELVEAALKRYPAVPALRIAVASFR